MRYVIYNDFGVVRKFVADTSPPNTLWTEDWQSAHMFDAASVAHWYKDRIAEEFVLSPMNLKICVSYCSAYVQMFELVNL